MAFVKIPAGLVAHCLFVFLNEFLLLFFSPPPSTHLECHSLGMTKLDVIWHSRLYHLALKLLSTPPVANTLETVGVVAVGEDPEVALARVGFLVDYLHADAIHHVLAALHSE